MGQYGYVQAVRVNDTIYVSGQLSHDHQGNMVGAAPLDDSKIRDHDRRVAITSDKLAIQGISPALRSCNCLKFRLRVRDFPVI